jgi:eukaryotic-like serine/threonine-protein kinase
MARALHYAHGQGVVHRDIKAQNVLLAADGTAKLADFGIARMIEADAASGLTRTDMLLGSADYLSPEQANGHALDARSDVYSLGIVLFECLTASLPFMGEGFVAVAMKHCSQPLPDPRTVVASIPPWLAAVVVRATQKDPDLRFPDAAAMAQALEAGPDGPADAGAQGTAVFPAPADAGRPAGGGNGAVGVAGDTSTQRRPRRERRRRRRALSAALIVALVALAATGAGLWIVGESGAPGDTPAAGVQGDAVALPIVSVRDLDPVELGGDGVENPDQRDLALDGSPDTAWFTERYQDSAVFGGLKEGVGLLLRVEAPAVLTGVEVTSPTPGATFEVHAVAGGNERPVLAEGTFSGEPQRLAAEPAEPAQNFILWITSLAPTEDGRFHAGVSQVSLQGVLATPSG